MLVRMYSLFIIGNVSILLCGLLLACICEIIAHLCTRHCQLRVIQSKIEFTFECPDRLLGTFRTFADSFS